MEAQDNPEDPPGGSEEHRSTATSAATVDPEKQEAIRRARERIEEAQREIRQLTGGRQSRAGSAVVNVGEAHAVHTKVTFDRVEQKITPTCSVNPDGSVTAINPPLPAPRTGESTESATESASRSSSSIARQQAAAGKQTKSLMEASYGTPADQREPREDEAIALRVILVDENGQLARIHVDPAIEPAIGYTISIANALGDGVGFRGKITEISDPLIVPQNKMTDLRRTERTKRRKAEREAARAATKAYQQEATGEQEVILDISAPSAGVDPPAPRAEETLPDPAPAQLPAIAESVEEISDDPVVEQTKDTAAKPPADPKPAADPKTAAGKTAEETPEAGETTGQQPPVGDDKEEKGGESDGKGRAKTGGDGAGAEEVGAEGADAEAAATSPKPGTSKEAQQDRGTRSGKELRKIPRKDYKISAGFQASSESNAADISSTSHEYEAYLGEGSHDEESEDEDDFVDEETSRRKRAKLRGKTSMKQALLPGRKKLPARAAPQPGSLEVAAWLRNIEDLNPPPEDDPAPLKEVMGLTGKVN